MIEQVPATDPPDAGASSPQDCRRSARVSPNTGRKQLVTGKWINDGHSIIKRAIKIQKVQSQANKPFPPPAMFNEVATAFLPGKTRTAPRKCTKFSWLTSPAQYNPQKVNEACLPQKVQFFFFFYFFPDIFF